MPMTESVSVSNHSFSISRWNVADVKIKPVKKVAYLDADLVTFPLVIREWRAGDYFYPFGMNMKKKKLKKFFTDEKIPLHEKEKILVIENNSKVLWVCGYRIDERFRVTDKTKSVLKIEFF
jgi:tRNA(Ile)-lysidine synthase